MMTITMTMTICELWTKRCAAALHCENLYPPSLPSATYVTQLRQDIACALCSVSC